MADFIAIDEIENYIDENVSTELTSMSSTLSSVSTKATSISTAVGNISPISSIQRGTGSFDSDDYTSTSITISSVTASKCLVIVNGWGRLGYYTSSSVGNGFYSAIPFVNTLSSTSLNISIGTTADTGSASMYRKTVYFSWQVIQFK